MRWLVLGAGVSGLGAAKLLRREKAFVRVSDNTKLSIDKADAFLAIGAELQDGGHTLEHLDHIDRIVASPGLPSHLPILQAAMQRQIPIISEIDLALERFHGQLIAVTGTNGKSTTCAMLAHMLRQAGKKVSLGGNFGDPPSAMLAEQRLEDLLILELSSYQLEQSHLIKPTAAIFTSFSHDHIARHGSLAAYLAAKWRIFSCMQDSSTIVLPAYVWQLAEAQGLSLPAKPWLYFRPEDKPEKSQRGFWLENNMAHFTDGESLDLLQAGIRESHNQLNAAYCICALQQIIPQDKRGSLSLLNGFKGLPHRYEPVGTINNHPVINDSKSTNVESTLVALASNSAPVILMMGGQGKHEPYSPLLEARDKIAALICFGASGEEIADAVDKELLVYRFPTLDAAMRDLATIYQRHAKGILFSPGCASFDEFKNYEERGRYFAQQAAKVLVGLKPM